MFKHRDMKKLASLALAAAKNAEKAAEIANDRASKAAEIANAATQASVQASTSAADAVRIAEKLEDFEHALPEMDEYGDTVDLTKMHSTSQADKVVTAQARNEIDKHTFGCENTKTAILPEMDDMDEYGDVPENTAFSYWD